jgi:hypothetical protein
MIELTLKIDPNTAKVSISAMVEGVETEIGDALSKPTAEEIGRTIINHVEQTASVRWPERTFRLRDSKSGAFVRITNGPIVMAWAVNFDDAKVFTNDVTELLRNFPTLVKVTNLG